MHCGRCVSVGPCCDLLHDPAACAAFLHSEGCRARKHSPWGIPTSSLHLGSPAISLSVLAVHVGDCTT